MNWAGEVDTLWWDDHPKWLVKNALSGVPRVFLVVLGAVREGATGLLVHDFSFGG